MIKVYPLLILLAPPLRVCVLNQARIANCSDFDSEISLIHLARIQFVGILLVGTKPGSHCSKLPLKAPEKDKEEIQKASLTAAK